MAMALLALCLIVDGGVMACSDYAIVKSQLRHCEHSDALEETCKMTTTAELTLANIGHDSCLWFHTKENRPLYSLKLKLEEVKCHFSTQRLYFTFPVEIRYKSQISCPQNKYCSWSKHCGLYAPDGLHFEAETYEAREYTGYSTCEPSNRGNGCVISHTPACAFKRVYFVPQLEKKYEVAKITGYTCAYKIFMEQSQNETKTRFELKNQATLPNGIQVRLLGAYDQSAMFFTQKLIIRVGGNNEGYLVDASEKNNPRAELVGSIQANSSATKHFLFAQEMTRCEFFEEQLRCIETPQALSQMTESQEGRLPTSKEFHQLHLKQGSLKSRLLSSAAIRLQLQFEGFEIAVQREPMCPIIQGDDYEVEGCYKCGVQSTISITARSSCKAGLASVSFETLQLYTKVVHLSTESTKVSITFISDIKCHEDKICLTSTTNVQCRQISFCLDEPSVELLQLMGKQTTTMGTQNSGSIFDWVHFQGLNSAYFVLKFAGAALLAIGLMITIASTCLTCLCKR